MDSWDAGNLRPISEETLRGRRCFSGLDLATVDDLTALVLVFPPVELDGPFDVLPYFWIPEDNLHARVRRDRVPYDLWQKQGFIKATPGEVIDYAYILAAIGDCVKKFDIAELAFDRWGSTKIVQDLQIMGFEKRDAKNNPKRVIVDFGQGFASMSPAVKEFLRLLLSKKLNHGGNPILRWMASNVVMDSDASGNLKPNKAKSTEKIDGITALLMAIDRAVSVPVKKRSKYETEGILMI
jgi:phage terminase large subunit-like protein